MSSWTDNFEELLDLLLSLPVSEFGIFFEADMDMQLSGMEDQFRKKLLGRLKESWRFRQSCCPFIRVPQKRCEACEQSVTCLFRMLYDPKAIRPFVSAFRSPEIRQHQTDTISITLFGYAAASDHRNIIVEEAASALSVLPDIYVREILADDPGFQQSPIRDRITLPAYRQDSVTLRFVTPVKLIHRTAITAENISFPVLIACILGRLKDLNKDLNHAVDIREIWETERIVRDRLSEIAGNVRVAGNNLRQSGLKVYSARQQKYVHLDGLIGEICFSGPIYPFYPLLRAAEIVHIGKKTAYGNGRVVVIE
jgi:hypothetical protein